MVQGYAPTIKYTSGRLHEDADALSRFPVRGTEEEEEKEVMLPVWLISEQPGTQQALRLEQEAETGCEVLSEMTEMGQLYRN